MSITSALFLSVITLALISAFLFIQHEINALKNQFGVDVPSSKSSLNRKIPKTSKQESKANPESGVYLYSEENEVKLLEEDDYGEKRKSNFRAAPNIFTVNARPGKITSDVEEAVEEDDYSKRETKFVQADSKVSETSHLAMAKSEGDITSPNSSPNIEGAHDIKNQIAISLKNKTVVEIEMLELINKLKTSVRAMRWAKTVMSRNETAILQTTRLQNVTRCFLLSRYGPGPYFVEMTLEFPEVMMEEVEGLKETEAIRTIVIEMAPIEWLPHAVFTFLEIVRTYKGGEFSRNAAHVLQASIGAEFQGGVVYMEYDRRYPHLKHTLGFAGRGGGNAIYINTIDNTVNHGPGTDRGGKDPEADTNFGRIVEGEDVVYLMQKQPGGDKSKNGFVAGRKNFIAIRSLRLRPRTGDADAPGPLCVLSATPPGPGPISGEEVGVAVSVASAYTCRCDPYVRAAVPDAALRD